jgi:hypothetical protein
METFSTRLFLSRLCFSYHDSIECKMTTVCHIFSTKRSENFGKLDRGKSFWTFSDPPENVQNQKVHPKVSKKVKNSCWSRMVW